jgi:Glucose-6-phosphate isomerase (GPI)/KDPG and KHG aldolase
MTSSTPVPEPGALSIGTDGSMQGRTGSYDKRLRDMRNVYRDSLAFEAAVAQHGEDFLVYRVEEHRNVDGSGALIIGTSTLLPGSYGDEFAVTRGHLHTKADRAELDHCLSGHGVLLLGPWTVGPALSHSQPVRPCMSRVTGFTAASMSEMIRSSPCSATRPMPGRTTASSRTRVAWRNAWWSMGMADGPLVRTLITTTLSALAGPFAATGVRFSPGGVDAGNAADYLRLPHVLAVGGTWIAPRSDIAQGRWTEIAERARSAAPLSQSAEAS